MIERNARKDFLFFLKARDLLKCHIDIVGKFKIVTCRFKECHCRGSFFVPKSNCTLQGTELPFLYVDEGFCCSFWCFDIFFFLDVIIYWF